jgi:hypothetical protein
MKTAGTAAVLLSVFLVLTLLGSASAKDLALTYPSDTTDLEIEVGVVKDVQATIHNNTEENLLASLYSEDLENVEVSFPENVLIESNSSKSFTIKLYSDSPGSFSGYVHLSIDTGGEPQGTGGGVSAGFAVPLRGTVVMPLGQSPEEIENMSAENAAKTLAGLDPTLAASVLATLSPENAGDIIDAAVALGLVENFADILCMASPSSAASSLLEASSANAARVMEAMVDSCAETAAEIAVSAAEAELEGAASILDEMETGLVATLLTQICDLAAPEDAGNLLRAISTGKSIAVTQTLIENERYACVNEMFGYLSDERLNDVWEGLTQEQKDALLPHLSSGVKDRIEALKLPKSFPTALLVGIITSIVIILVIIRFWLRRKSAVWG